jgi:hypothetical protein
MRRAAIVADYSKCFGLAAAWVRMAWASAWGRAAWQAGQARTLRHNSRLRRGSVLRLHFEVMMRSCAVLASGEGADLRIRAGLLLGICMHMLSGCAGVPVGLQKDGSYILDRSEQSLDCDRLYKAIWGRLQLMKQLPERAKAELEKTPPTAFLAMGRIFGGQNKGLATIDEYDREAAHVDALHRTMLQKNCARIDLERELADTEFAMSQLRRK